MAGIGYGRENQREHNDRTAPDIGSSLFFPEIYCAAYGAGSYGHVICDNFRSFTAEIAEETQDSSTDRRYLSPFAGMRNSGGADMDPFFLDCRESPRTVEQAGFAGNGIVQLCS